MPVSIADLFVTVSADTSAAVASLNALNTQVSKTTNTFAAAQPAALALTAAAGGIAAGFAGTIKTAADFEKQISGVKAVMAPGDVLRFGGALKDLALRLGAETTFSARQAAAGIEELVKAGIPAEAIMGGAARSALDLAAATGTDVATAATIAAQAMNAFGEPVSRLPMIVDRLAGVVNVSAADMADLRFGLQSAGAVAHTVGLSFEDTAAAIGIFANNGLRGQDAGTSLKTMLINLTPDTKAQTEAFKRLGLITANGANAFFDAQGHVKSLAGISGVLQNALKGMTDQQKLATLQVLFGTDAMRAAAILASTGADGVKKFTDQVAQISAADQAAERLNNLLGRLEQLGGALETASILVGDLFTPALGAVANTVKDAINAFSQMSPEARQTAVALAGIAGAIAGAAGGFVLLVNLARFFGPSFSALGGILLRLSPLFLALSAIAGGLAIAWERDLGGIRGIVQQAFDSIPGMLESLKGTWDTFTGDVGRITEGFADNALPQLIEGVQRVREFWQAEIGPRLGSAWDFLQDRVTPKIQSFVDQSLPLLQQRAASVRDFWLTEIQPRMATTWDFLTSQAGAKINEFTTSILPTLRTSADQVITHWETQLIPTLIKFSNALTGDNAQSVEEWASQMVPRITAAAQLIVDFYNGQLLPVLRDPSTALNNVSDSVERFRNIVGAAFGPSAAAPPQLLGILAIGDNLDELKRQAESLGPFIAALGNFASALITLDAAVRALEGRAVDALFEKLGTAFKSFADVAGPAQPAVEAVAATLGTIGQVLVPVTAFFNNAADAINKFADAINRIGVSPAQAATLPGVPAAPTTGGAPLVPAAFNPFGDGAAGGQAAISVNFNAPVNIGDGTTLEQFLAEVGAAVASAARRVSSPPSVEGTPSLVSGPL